MEGKKRKKKAHKGIHRGVVEDGADVSFQGYTGESGVLTSGADQGSPARPPGSGQRWSTAHFSALDF